MATVVDELVTRLTLDGVQTYQAGMDKSAGSLAKWAAVAATAGAVASSSGRFIADSLRAAADEQARFETASGNFKGSLPQEELEALATRLSRLTAVEDDVIAGTVGLLGTFQMTGKQATEMILPLLNSTRALEAAGKSSEGLAEAVGKAFQLGNLTGLRKMGIFVDETAFKTNRLQAIMDALQAQGGDAAIKFGASAAGGLKRGQNALDDFKEAVGGKFLNALAPAIESGTKLIEAIADNSTAATVAAAVIGVTFVGGVVVATRATWQLYAAVMALGNAYTQTGAKAAAAGTQIGSGGIGKGGLKGLGKGIGVAGTLGTAAVGVEMIPTGGNDLGESAKTVSERALSGAAVGALVGSIIPGLGTTLGGLIGAGIGVGGGMIADNSAKPAAKTEGQKTNELLEKQNELLAKALDSGKVIDFNRLSIAQQRAITSYGVAIA